jgi:hypothetical protein
MCPSLFFTPVGDEKTLALNPCEVCNFCVAKHLQPVTSALCKSVCATEIIQLIFQHNTTVLHVPLMSSELSHSFQRAA